VRSKTNSKGELRGAEELRFQIPKANQNRSQATRTWPNTSVKEEAAAAERNFIEHIPGRRAGSHSYHTELSGGKCASAGDIVSTLSKKKSCTGRPPPMTKPRSPVGRHQIRCPQTKILKGSSRKTWGVWANWEKKTLSLEHRRVQKAVEASTGTGKGPWRRQNRQTRTDRARKKTLEKCPQIPNCLFPEQLWNADNDSGAKTRVVRQRRNSCFEPNAAKRRAEPPKAPDGCGANGGKKLPPHSQHPQGGSKREETPLPKKPPKTSLAEPPRRLGAA